MHSPWFDSELRKPHTQQSTTQPNPTYEGNAQINFLDLQIIRKTTDLEIDMYRKPTTTDITIN
jgi:hypothetical protein